MRPDNQTPTTDPPDRPRRKPRKRTTPKPPKSPKETHLPGTEPPRTTPRTPPAGATPKPPTTDTIWRELKRTLCVARCPKCHSQLFNYLTPDCIQLAITHCLDCRLTIEFMQRGPKRWTARKTPLVYRRDPID